MNATQEQIEKLRTLQESYDILTDAVENQLPALADKIDNIDLTPIESKVDEGVSTLSTKIDNIDLSSVAKQGDNPNATMTGLLDAINAISPDIVQGKERLATAITSKGVETTSADSLSQMAENVSSIAQESYTIDGGEMYASQLYGGVGEDATSYNLYQAVVDIQSNALYNKYTGFLLAEYIKAGDTISLSGADAYLTSDGSFYEYGTEHQWNDSSSGKTNRWVAYFLGEEGNIAGYTIPNIELCPIRIHIGGKVGTINCTFNGIIVEVVVTSGNELGDLNFTGNQTWADNIIVNGIESHRQGYIVNANTTLRNLVVNCKRIESSVIINGKCTNLKYVHMPKLEEISNGGGIVSSNNKSPIEVISLDNLKECSSYGFIGSNIDKDLLPNLKKLYFPKLEHFYGNVNGISGLEEFIAPKLKKWIGDVGYTAFRGNNIKKIITDLSIFKFTNASYPFVALDALNLIDIRVGEINENIGGRFGYLFNTWTPINAMDSESKSLVDEGEPFNSNREKLLYNIREHIAANIKDRTGDEPLTIQFSQELRNIFDEETEMAFANKNWNISPAKSV